MAFDESEYSFYQSAADAPPYVEIRHTRSEHTVFELRDDAVARAIDEGLISEARLRQSTFAYAKEIGAFDTFERQQERISAAGEREF